MKNLTEFIQKIQEHIADVKIDFPMKEYTTFKVGGPADVAAEPQSEEEIRLLLRLAGEYAVPVTVIGNGSNLLVRDKGIRGLVVVIGERFSKIEVEDVFLKAQTGALLSQVAKTALDYSLTGLEFASGIPGSLGGGCIMNAGAYGGEMKDVLYQVKVMDRQGNVRLVEKEDMGLGYRTSSFQKDIVLEATMKLEKGNPEEIKEKMDVLNQKRRDKQPLNYPSAGSTFKRPVGYYAGALIEGAGLKGYQIGGAAVSEKHAGFVINKGDATAQDILDLIRYIQKTVQEKNNVLLEPEVKIIGEE